METRLVKATELGIIPFSEPSRLADGALVVGLSVQREMVYAKVLKDGHFRTRRYRHDQQVKVCA